MSARTMRPSSLVGGPAVKSRDVALSDLRSRWTHQVGGSLHWIDARTAALTRGGSIASRMSPRLRAILTRLRPLPQTLNQEPFLKPRATRG